MNKITVSGLLCLTVTLAHAQSLNNDTTSSRTFRLENVTVTEKQKNRQTTSTAPMHIIDKKDFLVSGTTDIADALNRMPGITLRDYGGAGGMKTVSVRSFGAQHTGVCYDGIMLSECQGGQIDVSRYSLDNVNYISLTVGDNDDIFIPAKNASTPAVLNIQTLKLPTDDTKPHLTSQIRIGSFGYISPFIRYEQNLSGKLAFSVTGEYVYADNDYPFTLSNISVVTEERRTNSRMKSGHGEMNFIWNVNKYNRLSGKVYYYDNDRQLPGQVRYYTNNSKETLHDQNFFMQMQYQARDKQNLSLKWNAKYNWSASKYADGKYTDGINDADYWQREFYTSACLLYLPSEKISLDYSADYIFNNLNSSLATDTRPYRNSVLQSLTAKYRNRRLTITGRLLYSIYLNDAKYGNAAKNANKLSPSLSLSYKLLKNRALYIRASYKNIFRIPTFNESYFYHYGSTNLLPESTDQYNVGITFNHEHIRKTSFRLAVDGYMNHVKDKIVAVPYNMFVWTNINVGKVRVMGLDAKADISHSLNARHKLYISASYSLQKAENRTNRESPYYGNQIAYIPLHSGSASVGYDNPWLNIAVHGTGTSRRHSNNEHYDGTDVAGYFEMGISAYRQFNIQSNTLTARCDIKNILDKQYEIVKAYPMPGISYQFSISYKF